MRLAPYFSFGKRLPTKTFTIEALRNELAAFFT